MEIIEFLKRKFYILRPLLRPFYKTFIANKQESMRRSVFQNNAINVLDAFDKAMKTGGYHYTLAFGSLLGAVREGGFIKHDLDIDTAMWAEDYNDRLQETLRDFGFKRIHCYTVDKGVSAREETYEKDGVSIDIFYIYPAIDEYPYCCDFLNHYGKESVSEAMKRYSNNMVARRIQLPMSHDIQYTAFESLYLPIPKNAEQILAFRYGADYMTPNPNWSMVGSYDKNITIWEGKKVVSE